MRLSNIIPNLPDVVMRRVFDFLSYRQLCKAECVCRRWQRIVLSIMRRNIHEITIERSNSPTPTIHQVLAFRRLSVSCAENAYDFWAGVIRRYEIHKEFRSRLSLVRMTADVEFLANIQHIHTDKDVNRKYFSNVEELWLLVVDCSDEVTRKYMQIEEMLFSEINFLTLQVHLRTTHCYSNIAKVISTFVQRHPKAIIRLEIHAERSAMIFDQLRQLPPISLRRIKSVCTEFNLPPFCMDTLYNVMTERKIKAKSIAVRHVMIFQSVHFNCTTCEVSGQVKCEAIKRPLSANISQLRDWTLLFDVSVPITAHPMDTFRISSCTVNSVDDLINTLRLTSQQKFPTKKRATHPTDGFPFAKATSQIGDRTVKVKKPTLRSRAFIKKLELAGQCVLRELQFLQDRAHEELIRRLQIAIPLMIVNCEDIYYFG